jgi:hypothetical protein
MNIPMIGILHIIHLRHQVTPQQSTQDIALFLATEYQHTLTQFQNSTQSTHLLGLSSAHIRKIIPSGGTQLHRQIAQASVQLIGAQKGRRTRKNGEESKGRLPLRVSKPRRRSRFITSEWSAKRFTCSHKSFTRIRFIEHSEQAACSFREGEG